MATTLHLAQTDGNTNITANISAVGTHVFEANSTSPALRITQTGTGPAILIEDSQNPDANAFLVDQTGTLVVGASAASGTTSNTTRLAQFVSIGAQGSTEGGGGGKRFFELRHNGDSSHSTVLQFQKTRSGSLNNFSTSEYPLSAYDSLGQIGFQVMRPQIHL